MRARVAGAFLVACRIKRLSVFKKIFSCVCPEPLLANIRLSSTKYRKTMCFRTEQKLVRGADDAAVVNLEALAG